MKYLLSCLYLCLGVLVSVKSAKILAICTTSTRSHTLMLETLTVELSKRGHELVIITMHPMHYQREKYRYIDVSGIIHSYHNNISMKQFDNWFNSKPMDFLTMMYYFHEFIEKLGIIFESNQLRELLASNMKFDLVINEQFTHYMFAGFAYKFKAPLISYSTSVMTPWAIEVYGNPDNPAYIPTYFSPYSGKMSFSDRLLNCFYSVVAKLVYRHFFEPKAQIFAQKYFGEDLPPLRDIIRNTSVVLVNSHSSLFTGRPNVPQVVEVGGIHIQPEQPLPQDLKQFLDNGTQGVVFISFGSMLRLSSMSTMKRHNLMQALGSIPQKVLLKWEVDELPEQPDNVRIDKWMPQRDILAHPNVKLFVSHGGLMSTMEAIYCGVPIIGVPFFSDQVTNVAAIEAIGAGITLEYHSFTEDNIRNALTTVLNNARYSNAAKELSVRFRDRPQKALDTAVYWTEYVLRHQGASHLQSAAVHLPWYQLLLLDVIIVIILSVLITISLTIYILKIIVRLVFRKKKEKQL